jgi:hypothetical protein
LTYIAAKLDRAWYTGAKAKYKKAEQCSHGELKFLVYIFYSTINNLVRNGCRMECSWEDPVHHSAPFGLRKRLNTTKERTIKYLEPKSSGHLTSCRSAWKSRCNLYDQSCNSLLMILVNRPINTWGPGKKGCSIPQSFLVCSSSHRLFFFSYFEEIAHNTTCWCLFCT